ncbi:MAG: hypothetical protein ACI4TF_13670 [Oliverpabstia sp.]
MPEDAKFCMNCGRPIEQNKKEHRKFIVLLLITVIVLVVVLGIIIGREYRG